MSSSNLNFILKSDGVLLDVSAKCKREALRLIAEKAAEVSNCPAETVLSTISEREKLGSTAVGSGVAIPHGKIEGLDAVTGVLARLESPVDFDAMDERDVDIVFMLLAPADATAAHLKALAKVSRFLHDEEALASIRGADSEESVYAIATSDKRDHAA